MEEVVILLHLVLAVRVVFLHPEVHIASALVEVHPLIEAALQQAYDLAHANAEKMRAMTLKLTNDISQLESRKDNIKAKAAAAKAQEKINQMVSGTPDLSGSLEAFDRMEEKVNKKLDAAISKAELDSELAVPGNLLSKYEAGSKASVEDELERLKKELLGQ